MTSNTLPPADHSALFSDPADLARRHEREAELCFEKVGFAADVAQRLAMVKRMDRHIESAKHYRRMARNGEQVPEF